MSHWNYRVMLKDGQYAVHEVFYEDDGQVSGYTAEPVFPLAESPEDLAAEFERYRGALGEAVLDYDAMEAEAESRRLKPTPPATGGV